MRAATLLLITVLLGLSAATQAAAQQQEEWTWKDRAGKVMSRADLDEILKQHRLWLQSNGKSGSQADLRATSLSGADLFKADLSNAFLDNADLGVASLLGANLSRADLWNAKLSGADLRSANLSRADLADANLSGADLADANLSGAYLNGADLSDARLSYANLAGAVFEPKNTPASESIASAHNIELMTYEDSPGPLTQLRKQFQDAGYRDQERAITCALNRHDASPSWLRSSVEEKWKSARGKTYDTDKIVPLRSLIEGGFKWIAFDLTCEYGFSPGRPLRIVGWFWLVFSFVYALFMHLPGTSGIYFIGTRWSRGRSNIQGIQIRPKPIPTAKWWKRPFLWLRREWRVLRAAMFFSLMSAFNIGFRDINFGRWIRLLTKREYDLKAVGWARTISGFQSLLSVYLIALWVLSYFGRPFG